MKRIALVIVFAAANAAGCGTPARYMNGTFEDDDVRYGVSEPGDGWRRVQLDQADIAWLQDAMDASLMVNSHCEGVKDAPLEALTNDLLMGMTEREVLAQEKVPWSRREALETVALAKLDGVQRKMAMFVGKKDGCVYDIVMTAPPDRFDAAKSAYDALKSGFEVGPRKPQ